MVNNSLSAIRSIAGIRTPLCPRGFTMVEVIVAAGLFIMLMAGVYRLFFSEIRVIRTTLEHIGVNENARKLILQLSNDVRNSNRIAFPLPIQRDKAMSLSPAGEGEILRLERFAFDFDIKPPGAGFIQAEKISYRLVKNPQGSYDMFRDLESEIPPGPGIPLPYRSTRQVCGGIKEITLFTTLNNPVKLSSFAGMPFKNLVTREPFDRDGTGPYLVNLRVTFVREGVAHRVGENTITHTLRTSFAVRGRLVEANP